jgi:hypothetical protein
MKIFLPLKIIKMKVLADENVEWTVVEVLRAQEFDVVAVHTDYRYLRTMKF